MRAEISRMCTLCCAFVVERAERLYFCQNFVPLNDTAISFQRKGLYPYPKYVLLKNTAVSLKTPKIHSLKRRTNSQ